MNEPRQDMPESETPMPDTQASRLIQIDADRPEIEGRDINAKIDKLDTSLDKLNTELDSIRDSVDEGLEKLGDNDLDLTSKVSDTYKRLGELDNTYKSLAEISSSIHSEIGRLTNDISRVATESTAELEKLEATSQVHNAYLTKQNDNLAQRVDRLVNDASETSNRLQLSIREVQAKVLTAEQKLVAEIGYLADTTKLRDDELARDIDVANSEVAVQAARIIQLNKVDEALEKRAGELERTTGALDADLQQLEESVDFLGVKSTMLSESIEDIVEHTASLQKASDEHGTRIGSLQQRVSNLAADLFDLGDTQRRHWWLSLAMLLLVAIAITGVHLKQDGDTSLLAERVSERAQLVESGIETMGQQIDTRAANINEKLGALQTNLKEQLGALQTDLNDKVVKLDERVGEVDRQLQHVDDKAQSINGRLSADKPYDNFGGDNIVHGRQWLLEQEDAGYMVQLAAVADSRQMYEITSRYGRYLNEPVSYYTDSSGRHVLLYGVFDSEAAAQSAVRNLPRRIARNYPKLRTVESVKRLL